MYITLTAEIRDKEYKYDSKNSGEAEIRFEVKDYAIDEEFIASLAPMVAATLRQAYQKYCNPEEEEQ